MTEAAVLASLVAAFLVLLAVKRVAGIGFCVLCVSVSATWLALLALRGAGVVDAPVLLALLMGQSIAGLNYLAERRVREELLVFRLPFVLTLTALFYLVVAAQATAAPVLLGLVAATWAGASVVYFGRHDGRLGSLARQIIRCCRDW